MEYALVNGERRLPAKGLAGICPGCLKEVVAKCGSIKLHHWAHKSQKDCDTWCETETEWHRNWKNHFPESYREVVFHDGENVHRADIYTKDGVTIEFQNSPISLEELTSRENFYPSLVWVVNGLKFKGGISFLCNLPDPQSPILKNFAIRGIGQYSVKTGNSLMFQEMPKPEDDPYDLYQVYSFRNEELKEVKELYERTPPIYWHFEWKHKHKAWFTCKSPVLFDFGDEFLYELKRRDQVKSEFLYLEVIKKADFIKKYSG